MRKLYFAYWWNPDGTDAWSGTPAGIYQALRRRCPLRELGFRYTQPGLLRKKSISGLCRLLHKDFDSMDLVHKANLMNHRLAEAEASDAVLLFAEYPIQKIQQAYLYQDLTVEYLLDLNRTNPELIAYTPLVRSVGWKDLACRRKNANKVYDRCAGLFTMSHFLCRYMKASGVIDPDKVHYVGGGSNVDPRKVSYKGKTGCRFLFVGRDFVRKNGPLVLQAFALVRKQEPQAELYIAGPENLDEYAPLPEGVVFLGRQSYAALPELYNRCDYFVMPSRFEAYGLVFAEALIYGLPCIGKNAFAMPEFIRHGENGYLIEQDDAAELAAWMQELMHHPEITRTVRQSHAQYTAQYSWDAVAQRMLKILMEENDGGTPRRDA